MDKFESSYNKYIKKVLIADLVKQSYDEYRDQRNEAILEIISKYKISEEDAAYLYDNFKEPDYEWVVEVATKLNIPIEEVIEDSGIDHIDYLVQQVESDRISLDTAQEDAWEHYRYSEGGLKSGPKSSSHASTTWGELFGGETTGRIEVDYEPIFESLGDTLDDDPIWLITRVTVTDNSKYPHVYNATRPEEHEQASIDMLENGSLMEWFNTYWHGAKF